MVKYTALTPALIVVSLFTNPAIAVVPHVDGRALPAIRVCPAATGPERIYHSDKIIFMLTDKLVAANPNDQPQFDALRLNTEFDIKVQDNPIYIADIKGKVLTFLRAKADEEKNRLAIRIVSVEYAAVVCPRSN